MKKIFEKDPDATLDFSIDWSAWLAKVSDTIQASEWVVPSGIALTNETFSSTKAIVWVSGGELGRRYELTNRITTSGGRIEDQSIVILIVSK
jgi:hypothetical protein